MITETGKSILAKYLIGQTPAYASYIAIGCGANPLNDSLLVPNPDNSQKTSLDFEMFRVPIISRGYVKEDGIAKIVFTAELPTEERYEISEVGVYSAGSNPSAGQYDSKTIYSFSQNEPWEYHSSAGSSIAIPEVFQPLDGDYSDNEIHNDVLGDPAYEKPVFFTNGDNRVFSDVGRIARYERPRFLNNVIMIAGNDSELNYDTNGHLSPEAGSNHIHLTGQSLSLNKNSPIDELRFAFSVVNKALDSGDPEKIKILLEFASTEGSDSEYAKFDIVLEDGVDGVDFATNRYFVRTTQLQNLQRSPGFTWNAVDVVKIFASVEKDGATTDSFYIGLDAVRLENVSSINPLYGLVGYSQVRTPDAETIVKLPNTSNFIEFRFAMDVQ